MVAPGAFSRSRPFDLQHFLANQARPFTMAADAEKARTSGEIPRASEPSPILPTVNPAVEKLADPPKPALHPAVYVMLVSPSPKISMNPGSLDSFSA